MVVIEGIPRYVPAAEFLLGNSAVGDGTYEGGILRR